ITSLQTLTLHDALPVSRDREPSRRSAEDVDLDSLLALVTESLGYTCVFAPDGASLTMRGPREIRVRLAGLRREAGRRAREDWPRSEEHTSELQSREKLV